MQLKRIYSGGYFFAFFVGVLLANCSFAATTTFTSTNGSADFNNASNWDAGLPGPNDTAVLDNKSANLTASITVGTLQLKNNSGLGCATLGTILTCTTVSMNDSSIDGGDSKLSLMGGTYTTDKSCGLNRILSITNSTITANSGVLSMGPQNGMDFLGSSSLNGAGGTVLLNSSKITFSQNASLSGNVQIAAQVKLNILNSITLHGTLSLFGTGEIMGTGSLTIDGAFNVVGNSVPGSTNVSIALFTTTATSSTSIPAGIGFAKASFDGPVALSAPGFLSVFDNGTINFNNSVSLTDASISGNGIVTIGAGGTLTSNNSILVAYNTIGAKLVHLGAINVASGALVVTNSGTATGVFNGTGGPVNFSSGSTTFSGTAALSGAIQVSNGGKLIINNAQTCTGSLAMSGGAVDGTGSLTMNGPVNCASGNSIGLAAFTIPSGQTLSISNGGSLLVGGGATLSCAGALAMTQNTTLNLNTNATVNCSGNITLDKISGIGNSGTITFAPTSNLTSTNTFVGSNNIGGVVTSSGTITSVSGTLHFDTFVQSAGILALAGGNLDGSFIINGGSCTGSGTINGNLTNSATLNLGNVPGTLNITRDFTQTSTGTLNVKLGGTKQGTLYDTLAVGGKAKLGGLLNIMLINQYVPAAGDALKVMSFGERSGEFAGVVSNGSGLSPIYSNNGITLALGSSNPNPSPGSVVVSLDNASIAEDNVVGAAVGKFSTTEPGTVNTYTYSLPTSDAGPDNKSFQISGNILQAAVIFDFNLKDRHTINVRSTDQFGLFVEKTFVISVTATPNSGGSGVINVSQGGGSVTNPVDGLIIIVTSSNGGVILLDVSLKSGKTASFSTEFSDVPGKSSVKTGPAPAHRYSNFGVYVATVTASDTTSGTVIARGRKTLVISAAETGETVPGARDSRGLLRALGTPSPAIEAKGAKGIKGKFIFRGGKSDTVSLNGTITLPANLDPSKSHTLSIGIGNIVVDSKLDGKGRGTAINNPGTLKSLKIVYLGVKKGSITTGKETAVVSAIYSTAGLVNNGFDTEGISSKSTDVTPGKTSAARAIQIGINFDGVPYESLVPVEFSISKNSEFGEISSRTQK